MSGECVIAASGSNGPRVYAGSPQKARLRPNGASGAKMPVIGCNFSFEFHTTMGLLRPLHAYARAWVNCAQGPGSTARLDTQDGPDPARQFAIARSQGYTGAKRLADQVRFPSAGDRSSTDQGLGRSPEPGGRCCLEHPRRQFCS